MTNEYEPWRAEGITELEYWKRRYSEARQELCSVVEDIEQIVVPRRCSDSHCVWGRIGRVGTNGGCQTLKLNRVERMRYIQELAKELVALWEKWKDV